MKNKYSLIGLLLIVALTTGSVPASEKALSGVDEQNPLRLYASERFGPIGVVQMNSLGQTVSIDGRFARGEEPIWGGELIKVTADHTVRVALESIGQVVISRGAAVRFARARASLQDSGYDVLVASILTGSAVVKLNQGAGAYVEAGTSILTASRGATFSVSVEDGRALLSTNAGTVGVQDQPVPQDVNIRVVDDLGRPVSSGSQFSVRARSTRQIQVQVTDKNDKPLPDLPVLFSLGDPCLGSIGLGAAAGLTAVQKSDNRGIASVPLAAGAARCTGSIVAKVQGTNASVTINATVTVATGGFWTTQNTLLVVGGAVAAGVTTGLVVSNAGSSEPITPVPPPSVKP